MATKKSNIATCWVVRLEGWCPAYVVADTWEQATVAAARFWGIPWGRFVAHMELERKLEARKNVCIKCGRVFFGRGTMCQSCEKGAQMMVMDSALEHYDALQQLMSEGKLVAVTRTPMHWKGYEVWQAQSMAVEAYDGELTSMADGDMQTRPGWLICQDKVGTVVIKSTEGVIDETLRTTLSQLLLTPQDGE